MFHPHAQIGPYVLIQKLGRGGFGEVWLAERRTKFVTTKVAVKLPHDDQIDHETIRQEATLWEQASGHPNILPIIDADEYNGQIVIVSEYAPDGSLQQWLKQNGKMPLERAVETTIQILDGLEFLHSRNIIHRDLKPANILLQGNTPRLADFGISRALRTTASSPSSNISGTFAYMSPEAFDGKRSVQTDVWAVGVNLYQFLSGELPFPQEETSELIAAIMMREFEPLATDIPQSLKNVIAKSLAKLPENRYDTTGDMREDLRRVLRSEAVSNFIQVDSKPAFPARQTVPKTNPPIFVQNSQNETVLSYLLNFGHSEKHKNHRVWIYTTIALALISVIGFGVYFLANQKNRTEINKNEAIQVPATQSSTASISDANANAISEGNTNLKVPTHALDIRKVNFNKVAFPLSKNEKESELTQKDRTVKRVVFGDLNNDGIDDAVVLVLWSFARFGGNGYWYSIYVYRVDSNALKNIARMDGGSKNGNEEISGINVQNSNLITQWCVNYPNNSYDRFSETRIYKMNSEKISLLSKSKGNAGC